MKPSLAERLRAVVGSSPVPRVHPDALGGAGRPDLPAMRAVEPAGEAAAVGHLARARQAAGVLGGAVDERPDGVCILVDRRYEADARHGRHRVGEIVAMLQRADAGLTALGRAWPSARGAMAPGTSLEASPLDGLCALDLETTGLAGGAGTQAFLIGCARIEDGAVHVRQFLAPGFEGERAQLAALAEWMGDRTHLLTFNGRTFDLPLLEMRFAFNRLSWPWQHLPHLDVLHPARRLWRERPAAPGPAALDESGCSLGVLEKRLGGLHRVGDVPGFEIPARFFQFARDGRAEPLAAVLEHNRIDLLSTLLVAARAAMLVVGGPSAAEHGHECLGLGRIYERLDDAAGAETCFARVAAQARGLGDGVLAADALRRLALLQRRRGRPDLAAASWEALLDLRGVPLHVRREAREALAIHHEHRGRDFDAARTLVLASLAEPLAERHRASSQRRLARLDRKLGRQRAPGALMPRFDDEPR